MVPNDDLLQKVRHALAPVQHVTEKKMFGGVCFMVDNKMCVCVRNNEMMCRIGPDQFEAAVETNGCRAMVHNGKTMKGFVFVGGEAIKTNTLFMHWIDLSLKYNRLAKPARKKASK